MSRTYKDFGAGKAPESRGARARKNPAEMLTTYKWRKKLLPRKGEEELAAIINAGYFQTDFITLQKGSIKVNVYLITVSQRVFKTIKHLVKAVRHTAKTASFYWFSDIEFTVKETGKKPIGPRVRYKTKADKRHLAEFKAKKATEALKQCLQ